MYTGKNKFQTIKWRFIFLVIGVVVCAQIILLYTIIVQAPSGIYVTEVILTSKIDEADLPVEQVSNFSQDESHIYAFIVTKGILSLSLKATMLVKWYYVEGEQIASHYFQVDTNKPAIIWIDPPEGKKFHQGNYKIEIFIEQTLVKTVEFKIK